LQPGDLAARQAAQARRAQLFEAGLQAHDILLDLLDKGEVISERGQPGVGLAGRRINERRASGDQCGIDAVVLGPAQM
jgi:hypothetical protein